MKDAVPLLCKFRSVQRPAALRPGAGAEVGPPGGEAEARELSGRLPPRPAAVRALLPQLPSLPRFSWAFLPQVCGVPAVWDGYRI